MQTSLDWSRSIVGFSLMWIVGLLVPDSMLAGKRPGQVSSQTVLAGNFPSRISFKLMSAMKIAAKKIEHELACREMFLSLTDDPLEALHVTSYHLAGVGPETEACEAQGIVAYTTVGGHRTHLCPPLFERLNTRQAAIVLIHEALHRAGLSEWPPDPNGMTSNQINAMVQSSCNL